MNIDLLFTRKGEAGLIANQNWVQKAVGILLDTESGLMTVEFKDMDYLEMNIPADQSFYEALDRNETLHVAAVIDGHISQAYQVPLMFLDDPYRAPAAPDDGDQKKSLLAFEQFMRACVMGQPVHRDDLTDDNSAGCILGEASPSSLQFAPHLARQHALEAKPDLDLTAAPSAPGLGSGGGVGGRVVRSNRNAGQQGSGQGSGNQKSGGKDGEDKKGR